MIDHADADLLIDFRDVTLRRDGHLLVGPVSWQVELDERWVVIGPNGAGKTSLLRLAAAMEYPSSGTGTVLGERLGRTNLSELRQRVGLSSSALAQRIPDNEVVRDLVVSAGGASATTTSTTFVPSTRWRASVPNTWPTGPTARCRRASESA